VMGGSFLCNAQYMAAPSAATPNKPMTSHFARPLRRGLGAVVLAVKIGGVSTGRACLNLPAMSSAGISFWRDNLTGIMSR